MLELILFSYLCTLAIGAVCSSTSFQDPEIKTSFDFTVAAAQGLVDLSGLTCTTQGTTSSYTFASIGIAPPPNNNLILVHSDSVANVCYMTTSSNPSNIAAFGTFAYIPSLNGYRSATY